MDDNVTLHVYLANIDGGPFQAVQRVARGRGTAMDWELAEIYNSPDRWKNIRWYDEHGKLTKNPFE